MFEWVKGVCLALVGVNYKKGFRDGVDSALSHTPNDHYQPLTTDDIAAELPGVSEVQVRSDCQDELLPAWKHGRDWAIWPDDARRYINWKREQD